MLPGTHCNTVQIKENTLSQRGTISFLDWLEKLQTLKVNSETEEIQLNTNIS